MTEDQQAELLARWLEEGGPPPGGVDDDALEAMFALRPGLAPGPRLSVDDILAGVRAGPLAAPVGGAAGGAGQAPIPAGASLGAPPEMAPELGSSRRRRPWFLAAFGVAGAGGVAAAALALVVVGGSLLSTNLAPSADEAPVASSPAKEWLRPSPRPAVAARPAPMPVQREALPLELATRADEPRERQIAEGLPELAAGRFDAEVESAKTRSAERDADDAKADEEFGGLRGDALAEPIPDALGGRDAQGPPPSVAPSPIRATPGSAPPAARPPSASMAPTIPEVAAPSLDDAFAEEASALADEDKAERASDVARAKREQSSRKEVESEKKREETRRRPAAKPAAANTYTPGFDEVAGAVDAEPEREAVSLEGGELAPAQDPAEPVAQPSAPAGSGASAPGPAPTSAAAHAGTSGASDASITEVRALLLTQGPGAALAAADRHLAVHAANTPVRQALLALKGDAHAALGQTALAETAWRQAIALRDAR